MSKRWWLLPASALLAGSFLTGTAQAAEGDVNAPRMSVGEQGFGTDVVDRELVGKSERFEEGDTVWFWTRVLGGSPGDRIYHVWMRKGEEVVKVGLSIGGAHWRTYSRKTLSPGSAGKWRVEVRDGDGNVLATGKFSCRRPGATEDEPVD